MTSLQIKKLKMYMALRVLLGANLAILEKLPNATVLLTALDNAIADIQSNIALQQVSGKELKEQQNKLHDKVVQDVMNVSRRMAAYADAQDNKALLKECELAESKISRLKDIELIQIAKGMYNLVNTYLEQLSPYGLIANTQTTFLNDINLYEASIPQMEKTELDHTNVTATLNENYKTADKVVSRFDTLVEMIRTTETGFYADYKVLRRIEMPTDVVQLVAKITDAVTGAGIPNVTVSFRLNGSTADPIVKQTAEKGGFQIKSIENGIYTVTVEKIGYLTKTLTLTLPGDEQYSMEVKMVKNP
jgi:hypothetical protein